MALWQFNLLLIPKRLAPVLNRSARSDLTMEEFDSGEFWDGQHWDRASEQLIDKFSSKRASWDPTTQMWGEEGGDRLHVTVEGGKVVEITARIDARHVNNTFIQGLVALALHLDCVFVSNDFEVIPPLLHEVTAAMERSSARRFVSDPYKFLESGDSERTEW
jgi:hypothetical protein